MTFFPASSHAYEEGEPFGDLTVQRFDDRTVQSPIQSLDLTESVGANASLFIAASRPLRGLRDRLNSELLWRG